MTGSTIHTKTWLQRLLASLVLLSPALSPVCLHAQILNTDPPSDSMTVPAAVVPAQTRSLSNLNNAAGPAEGGASHTTRFDDPAKAGNLGPEAPTEFQQMVSNSIGTSLNVYGSDLFRNTPSTFAPLDKVPVTPDYVIGPGDELLLQLWGQVTLDSHFTVDRSGNIYIPQVGTVRVAGLSFGQLHDNLKSQIGRVFHNFDLNVNLGQLRSIQIFVVGYARRPGSYTISSLSTLVNALFATGGPSLEGTMRDIQVKRSGKVVASFDLYALLQSGDKSSDVQLLPGDIIYIPAAGPQIAIAGSVNAPAIYELKPDPTPTVADALALAAGPTSIALNGKLRLERIDAHRMRSIRDLSSTTEWASTTLQDGDILEVISIVDRYSNGVTLRGNVANPGNYAWHTGMRVGDLFPDKDALITRNYWLKREQLGQPFLFYLPTCPAAPPVAQANLIANHQDCIPLRENMDAGTTDFQRFNSTDVAGNRNRQEQAERSGTAAGISSASAQTATSPGQFEAINGIALSEPDIDWSYAVIERQDKATLTTSLLPFNLGRLVLQGDASQNLTLEPEDVVTIFSKADIRVPQAQQTRLVHLEGEFVSSGVYSVLPGETLRDLVARAGGFSSDAYLYGSEFTRESTRRVQQQRLNEYIDQIALQSSTNAANSANRVVTALDSAATVAAAAQSQNIVNNLRQTRASGRIVLQLPPGSDQVAQLPALALEDGDRFVVPHVPSTVSVTGSVYTPNTFLYDSHRRLKDYLQLAGGPNRDADRKNVYLIRADGSVISKRQFPSYRKDSFDSLRIYPGDTIIVPLDLSKGTTLRNVIDVAQIVGQFGVAAAVTSAVY